MEQVVGTLGKSKYLSQKVNIPSDPIDEIEGLKLVKVQHPVSTALAYFLQLFAT